MFFLAEASREWYWRLPGGCIVMSPEGWLIDHKGRWLLLFQTDSISSQQLPPVYMDKWNVSSVGTPNTFIDRWMVDQEAAIKIWKELTKNGWRKIEQQFGEAA